MYDTLHQWCRENTDYLKQYEPTAADVDGKPVPSRFYLRVVNRVYLVKTVDVSLFSNRASDAEGSAGVSKPVELMNISNVTEAAKQFDAVNKILSSAGAPAETAASSGAMAVGGTLKLAMATSRSVSLVETFRRPLVIGYLASDFPIGSGGSCAPPVPTFNLLEGRGAVPGKAIEYKGCDENCARVRSWVKQPGNQQRLAQWLETNGNGIAIADLLTGDYSALRTRVVADLIDSP